MQTTEIKLSVMVRIRLKSRISDGLSDQCLLTQRYHLRIKLKIVVRIRLKSRISLVMNNCVLCQYRLDHCENP